MLKRVHKLLVMCLLGLSCFSVANEDKNNFLSKHVNKEGKISFPSGFDMELSHLGSWFVPEGDASGFHDVYTEKQSIESFREIGKFPDGTTLVKELRASHVGDFTTGAGVKYSTTTIKQWFVMIKDSKNRFKDNLVWGDGWGWALYKPDDTSKNLVTNYKTDCLGCHVPVKDKDWVYTQGYPILFQTGK